jgi:hypothetical protein
VTDALDDLLQIYDDLKTTCYYMVSEHVPNYIINDDEKEEPGFYGLEESVTGLDKLLVIIHPDHKDKIFEDTKYRIKWKEATKDDWTKANKVRLDALFVEWKEKYLPGEMYVR